VVGFDGGLMDARKRVMKSRVLKHKLGPKRIEKNKKRGDIRTLKLKI
jgi:hypothetical protein